MSGVGTAIFNSGVKEGLEQGDVRTSKLFEILCNQNRMEDVVRATKDAEFRNQLYDEFDL